MGRPSASAQLGARLTAIHELPDRLAALEGVAAERAQRLLDVRVATARMVPHPGLEPWLARTFGSIDAVREQTVVKVANLVTGEATLFAPLRARRPIDGPTRAADLANEIQATGGDPFCDPEAETPSDTFGRVRGAHMVTGANVAAADSHHAVLVFERHDPLDFDADVVADLFATARTWADRAREDDPEAANYLLVWNCLWRAGGSIIHGHAQALLGSGRHYARLERFRRDAASYRAAHAADLAADLGALHADLGLAVGGPSVTTFAHVTPLKEREVVVVGQPGMDERDPSFTAAVAHAVLAYRDILGVRSFNLALWRPPLDRPNGWEGVPPIVRLVDRGDPSMRASDIGAMELYGTPIVGVDPYEVATALRGT